MHLVSSLSSSSLVSSFIFCPVSSSSSSVLSLLLHLVSSFISDLLFFFSGLFFHLLSCLFFFIFCAGTHGDVLNLHTEAFWTDTRGRRGEERERRGATASPAHQEKPTKSPHPAPQVHRKKPLVLTHSKFESKSRTTRSGVLQSSALPDKAVQFQES